MESSGPGMPSNHAQFAFFLVTFWSLHVYNTNSVRFAPTAPLGGMLYRHLLVAGLVAAAVGVAFARVYLGYHYLDQVVVGAALGLALGGAWYVAVAAVLRPVFKRWLEPSALCRFFYLRDNAHVPNILQREYELTLGSQYQASGGDTRAVGARPATVGSGGGQGARIGGGVAASARAKAEPPPKATRAAAKLAAKKRRKMNKRKR
jgi:hypothetical protein